MNKEECLKSLPDLLTFNDGTKVENEIDWQKRRLEVYEAIIPVQYGVLPPAPDNISFELLNKTTSYIDSVESYMSGRIRFDFEKEMTFGLNLYLPRGEGPFPVVIFGDGCWPRYTSNEVIDEFVGRGYVFAIFNRCELAKDVTKDNAQDIGLYDVAPQGNYGALAAWAWGYHRVVDVLADMYLNSLFRKIDVEGERKVIVEELMMDLDQPQSLAQQLMDDCLWMGHPVGRPIIGNLQSLEKITQQHIVDYQKKVYTGKNTVVTFAGKIKHQESLKLVEKYFSHLDAGRKLPLKKAPREDSLIEPVGLIDKDINQGYMSIGFKSFGKHDERRFALNVLTSILGGNMSSRLFQTVREKHGLAYYVHSGGQLFRDCGAVIVSAGIQTEQRLKALDLIGKELLKIKTVTVSNSELRRAKDFIIGQFLIGKESTSSFMLWLGEAAIAGREEINPEETLSKIESVSKDDVINVAKTIFRSNNSSVAIVAKGIDDSDSKQIVDTFGKI